MNHYRTDIDGKIDQGDILYPVRVQDWIPWWDSPETGGSPIIILTPTCDVAWNKADHHRFCVLQPFPLYVYVAGRHAKLSEDEWQGRTTIGKEKSKKFRKRLAEAVSNKPPRYHFLPKQEGVFSTDRFVDFEVIGSIPLHLLSTDTRIARLNSPFKEELIHRFSHHIMRIGTTDFDDAFIDRAVDNTLEGLPLQIAG